MTDTTKFQNCHHVRRSNTNKLENEIGFLWTTLFSCDLKLSQECFTSAKGVHIVWIVGKYLFLTAVSKNYLGF